MVWFDFFLTSVTFIIILALFAGQGNILVWVLFGLWVIYVVAKIIILVPDIPDDTTGSNSDDNKFDALRTPIIPISRSSIIIWSAIAFIVLVVLILYSIAQRLPSNSQGYTAFFTALGAIGACITGIALAVFAYLTWAVSYRQQETLLFPFLGLRMVYTYPHHGERVFEDASNYYHGIKWEVEITNPGSVPIEILRYEFGIENTKTGKTSYITGLPCHAIFEGEGNPVSELGFFIRPSQIEKRTLVIYYDEIERELVDMIGVSDRQFKLYFDLKWLSRGKEKIRRVESSIFYLPNNAILGIERKAFKLI